MTPETISKDFDQDILPALPRWARNDSQVVEACRHSLSFRADVFRAKTPGMKRLLKRTASNYIPETARCARCGRKVEVEGGAYTYGFDGTAPALCDDCSR